MILSVTPSSSHAFGHVKLSLRRHQPDTNEMKLKSFCPYKMLLRYRRWCVSFRKISYKFLSLSLPLSLYHRFSTSLSCGCPDDGKVYARMFRFNGQNKRQIQRAQSDCAECGRIVCISLCALRPCNGTHIVPYWQTISHSINFDDTRSLDDGKWDLVMILKWNLKHVSSHRLRLRSHFVFGCRLQCLFSLH